MTRMAIGAAIAAAWAVPAAAADFTGPRFDLVTGYDRADGFEGVIYGGFPNLARRLAGQS